MTESARASAATVTLPTYGTTGGVKKAFLTPLTVTGDTLVVGVRRE